ncbi:MAG: serine/threonine transporter SstT [Eggerthellaceae bacterium]
MNLRQAWAKWNEISLVKRILVGLIIGAIVGVFAPAGLSGISMLGDLFVGALKAVAPILVFFLVLSALANAKGSGAMKRVIVLYIISTLVASLVAVSASFLFPLDITLAAAPEDVAASPQGIGEVLTTLLMNMVANPVDSLVNANYLGILVWAVLLGIALRAAKEGTKTVFANIAEAVTTLVRWIISFAPFGIFGLVYTAVSENGVEIFTEYGQLILLLVACMLIIAFVTNPLIVWFNIHKNPYPLVWRCLRTSGLTAFFTRSSAANIPVNMQLCADLGLNKDNYSVAIPLGATINMAGASVTISVMTMAAAHTLGISVDLPTAVILCVLAAVSACGASGVAGGSLLLIPLACSLFGIGNDIAMQVVGIGFIIGVIQDSCETALNSSSDALFAATAEYVLWNKSGKKYKPGKNPEPSLQEQVETASASETIK